MTKEKTKQNERLNLVISTMFSIGIWLFLLFFLRWSIPEVRYRDDKTDWYKIETATILNDKVKACESAEMLLVRTALIDLQGHVISELILVRTDSPDKEVAIVPQEISINKGTDTVVVDLPVPCKAPAGNYYWRGTIKYKVGGYDHITTYRSNEFSVVK